MTGVRCLADQLIYPACEPLFGPSGYAGTATLYLVATADGRFVSLSSRHGQRRVHPDPWKSISWLRVCKRRITQTNAPASTMVCFIVPSSLPPKNFSRAGTPMTDSQHRRGWAGGGRRRVAARARISRAKGEQLGDGLPLKMWWSRSPIPIFTTTTTSCSVRSRAASPARRQTVGPSARAEKKGSWRNGRRRSPRLFCSSLARRTGRSWSVSGLNV